VSNASQRHMKRVSELPWLNPNEQRRKSLADRFWEKVAIKGADECWEWQATRNASGYGRFKVNGVLQSAHRVVFTLDGRSIPDGAYVLHVCDNPPCCNPAHLILGDQTDNMRDMLNKGRGNHAKGSGASASKLSELDIPNIRQRLDQGETPTAIAKTYGVSDYAIYAIQTKRTWTHV